MTVRMGRVHVVTLTYLQRQRWIKGPLCVIEKKVGWRGKEKKRARLYAFWFVAGETFKPRSSFSPEWHIHAVALVDPLLFQTDGVLFIGCYIN